MLYYFLCLFRFIVMTLSQFWCTFSILVGNLQKTIKAVLHKRSKVIVNWQIFSAFSIYSSAHSQMIVWSPTKYSLAQSSVSLSKTCMSSSRLSSTQNESNRWKRSYPFAKSQRILLSRLYGHLHSSQALH